MVLLPLALTLALDPAAPRPVPARVVESQTAPGPTTSEPVAPAPSPSVSEPAAPAPGPSVPEPAALPDPSALEPVAPHPDPDPDPSIVEPPSPEPEPASSPEPEVSGPEIASAPEVGPDEPAPAIPTFTPAPSPPPLPQRRGTGMLVAGGLLGAIAIPLKIKATVSDLALAEAFDSDEPPACFEICYIGPFLNLTILPLVVTSAGLLGGGAQRRGRWATIRDEREGIAFDRRRNRLTLGLGFGLVSAGTISLIASRIALRTTETHHDRVVAREVGWWLALAMVPPGAALAGWGMGQHEEHRRAQARQVQVMPVLSSRLAGVGVAGRF
ncbi:MAG: hypothetical protein H6712_28895 [Myxococcales bacterium]|nr:hypothetical protein [Myxococcales bacterium]MCB9717901.1 hypothetical protein [Myxococcales bacterium]